MNNSPSYVVYVDGRPYLMPGTRPVRKAPRRRPRIHVEAVTVAATLVLMAYALVHLFS